MAAAITLGCSLVEKIPSINPNAGPATPKRIYETSCLFVVDEQLPSEILYGGSHY